MRVLGVIPARAASKRLPGKNMADLGGKFLIQWTIEAAREACIEVVVSTDDLLVLELCKGLSIKAIHRRKELCLDDTPSIDVVRDVWGCGDWSGTQYDAVMLLQPTSPFRTADDISASLDILTKTGGQAVVSVTDAEVEYVFELGVANRLRPVKSMQGKYVPNGAIYTLTNDAMEAYDDWWTANPSYAYLMPKSRSLDIDTPSDLALARRMIEKVPA